MDVLNGRNIGRYHILEQLGEGGMATVYKAYDTRLECDVAVKVVRSERLTIETMGRTLKRFDREAKALAQLNHSNIVKITDYGEFEGSPYLVMAYYMPGGTLKERLGKPWPWDEAIRTLIPIAHALEYAHGRNFIHRDVKPSNILMTDKGGEGQPMLSDFGIAKLLNYEETIDLTGPLGIGTAGYMAPEQFDNESVDGRVDVYSLGVLLYEMITGRKPYEGSLATIIRKQASEPIPPPHLFVPKLPARVEAFLFQSLDKDPTKRFLSMGAMEMAMERLLAEPAKKKKQAPINKRRVITIVSLVIIIGAGTILVRRFINFGENSPGHLTKLETTTPTRTSKPSTTLTYLRPQTNIVTQTLMPSLTLTSQFFVTRTPGRPVTYTFQPGEFPYCIARRYNINPNDLLALNNLSSGQVLSPPITLKIPQTGSFPGNTSLNSHPTTYVVAANDTIYSVACYFGNVFPEDIIFQNKLTPP